MMAQSDMRNGVDLALEPLEQHWRHLFNGYDLDNDGQIDVDEFIAMLINDTNEDINPRVIQRLQALAKHGDRCVITFPEFINLLNDKNPENTFQRIFLLYIKHIVPPRSRARTALPKSGEQVNAQCSIDAIKSVRNYEDEYSSSPPALCMVVVSVLQVFVFLMESFKVLPGQNNCLLTLFPQKHDEVWRFLTYMLVHDGILHLLINVIVQILLGLPLEMVHGWWRVLLVYLAGVLAGSLGTSICDPNAVLVGASGGVYALLSAHVATIILNWSEMKYALYQLLVFLCIAIVDVKRAIESRYHNNSTKIAFAAHFAGGLGGLLVGLYILRNIEVHSWEKKLSCIAVITYIVLIIAMVIRNVLFNEYFSK